MSGWSKSLYALIIIAIITGIADYYNSSLGFWYNQNWLYVTIIVAICFPAWFFAWYLFEIIIPVDEEYRQKEELKKSIILKKILLEKENELNRLNLTDEEKKYQLEQWVKDAEETERRRRLYGPSTESESSSVAKEPPLSQRAKESMINKVGTKCCYPNCAETLALEVHHISPRAEGGTNDENNLIVLCNNHHHLADRGATPKDRLRLYSVGALGKNSTSSQVACRYCGTIFQNDRNRCPECGARIRISRNQ
jgi:5-methylcytosine-specific restriction endonuclease McrA